MQKPIAHPEYGKAILFERLTPTIFCRKDDRLEEWESWEGRSTFEGGAIDLLWEVR
jgi:hypothetical protein